MKATLLVHVDVRQEGERGGSSCLTFLGLYPCALLKSPCPSLAQKRAHMVRGRWWHFRALGPPTIQLKVDLKEGL